MFLLPEYFKWSFYWQRAESNVSMFAYMSAFTYFGPHRTDVSAWFQRCQRQMFPRQISKETFCWLFALIIFRIILVSNTCQQSLAGRKTEVNSVNLSLFYFLSCGWELVNPLINYVLERFYDEIQQVVPTLGNLKPPSAWYAVCCMYEGSLTADYGE